MSVPFFSDLRDDFVLYAKISHELCVFFYIYLPLSFIFFYISYFIPGHSYTITKSHATVPFLKQKSDDALSLHPCGCGTQPSAIPLRSLF